MSSIMTALESELHRERVYTENWYKPAFEYLLPIFSNDDKFVKKLIIRYLFMKIASRFPDDDPMFVHAFAPDSVHLIEEDLKFLRQLKANDPKKIVSQLDSFLEDAQLQMQTIPSLSPSSDELIEKIQSRCTVRNGVNGSINDSAVASCLRYHYMNIQTIGLALKYEDIGYRPSDPVLEGFASSINRYFDNYCSAFPDVDVDSQGSFFDLTQISQPVLMVNPPFDLELMNRAIAKCFTMCKVNKNLTCHLSLPDWDKWPQLNHLVKSSFSVKRVPKKDSVFVDYSSNQVISPCNIVMCYFGCVRQVDELGKIIV